MLLWPGSPPPSGAPRAGGEAGSGSVHGGLVSAGSGSVHGGLVSAGSGSVHGGLVSA